VVLNRALGVVGQEDLVILKKIKTETIKELCVVNGLKPPLN